MRIRHLVAVDNLDSEGFIAEPRSVRHGIVAGGRVADLAGPIDPLMHLNLDFPAHRLDDCLVAERLEVGAPILWDGERFRVARAHPSAYAHLGAVDLDRRRAAWQRAAASTSSDEA
ncbi:MAG TPA: hypothetical protein VF897_00455 [Roseiflexaceae bacterium]